MSYWTIKYENSNETLKKLLKIHRNIKKEEKTYHPRILMFCCFFSPNNTTAHRVLEYVWSTAGSRPKTSKKISTRVIRIIPIWCSLSVCRSILAFRSLTRKEIVCVDNLITWTIQIVQWIYIEFWISTWMKVIDDSDVEASDTNISGREIILAEQLTVESLATFMFIANWKKL